MTSTDILSRICNKLASEWPNLGSHTKRSWLHFMKYDLGLTTQEIGVLLGLTNGQARYAWWKYGR